MIRVFACTLFTTQDTPVALGISQALLLGIVLIAVFGVEVFATGLVAKKLAVFDANYGKALWAAVLKNGIFAGASYLLDRYVPDAPRIAVLIPLATVAPIIIYKLVFESTVAQAALIWILVLLVEGVVAFVLVYAAMSLGATLDERFDLATESGSLTIAVSATCISRRPSGRLLLGNVASTVPQEKTAQCIHIS